jgi:hypothetical protein
LRTRSCATRRTLQAVCVAAAVAAAVIVLSSDGGWWGRAPDGMPASLFSDDARGSFVYTQLLLFDRPLLDITEPISVATIPFAYIFSLH